MVDILYRRVPQTTCRRGLFCPGILRWSGQWAR